MTATNETPASGNPKSVTFDTLSAAQGLREIGFDHIQAEGIVTTISTAVSQTVATKADLALVRKDIELVRKDMEASEKSLRGQIAASEKSLRGQIAASEKSLRGEIAASEKSLRGEIAASEKSLRGEIAASEKSLLGKIEASEKLLRQEMRSMQDKIVIKLGGLMVTMTFLLLAIGPFYFRWVNSLLD